MTTTTTLGQDIRAGHIIGVRDRSVFGHHTDQFLVIQVLNTYPVTDLVRHVEGVCVMADETSVHEPVMVTIAHGEEVDLYGQQNPNDWSADFARGMVVAVRAIREEVNE